MERIDALNKEIAARNTAMDAARAKAKAEIAALVAERDQLLAEQSAKTKLSNLSPAERKAMAQLIQPVGVESEAKVGTPGT